MDNGPDGAAERRPGNGQATEFLSAAILSFAALGSAYATYQADLWDGKQAAYYAQAQQARTSAGKEESIALQIKTVDALLFTQWLNARAAGEPALEEYYRARFRRPFRELFERWIATRPESNPKSPATPFELAGYDADIRQKNATSSLLPDALFKEGERANNIGDFYGQSTVLFSLALFLGGIGQVFRKPMPKRIVLVLAGLCLVLALARIASLPAIRLI